MKLTIAAACAAPLMLAGAAHAECFAAFAEEGRELAPLNGYVLEEEAARPGPVARPPLPEDAAGLLCVREAIAPDANDFKILHHGIPLFIQSGDTMLALGFAEDEYVVTIPQGEIDEAERDAIVDALESFNEGEAELARWYEENEPDALRQP